MKRYMKKFPKQFLESFDGEESTFGAFVHWMSMNMADEVKINVCGKLCEGVDF